MRLCVRVCSYAITFVCVSLSRSPLVSGLACDPRSAIGSSYPLRSFIPPMQFAVCGMRVVAAPGKLATESGATEAPRLRIPHLVTLWTAGPVAPVLSGVFAQYCTGVFAQYYVLRSIMCSVGFCIVASLYCAIRRIMARAPYCLEVLCHG